LILKEILNNFEIELQDDNRIGHVFL